MKKIKFKSGVISNCFKITPCLQITYCGYAIHSGFAIEASWGKWGVGVRFY